MIRTSFHVDPGPPSATSMRQSSAEMKKEVPKRPGQQAWLATLNPHLGLLGGSVKAYD